MLNPRFKFAAILLAAGLSSRFGNGNKLLHVYKDKSLILHSLTPMLQVGFEQVIVVTGHEGKEINKLVEPYDVEVIKNENYLDGMGSSLATGIKSIDRDIDGVFICLADMPDLEADVFYRLSDVFSPQDDRTICAPVFDGQRGHPVLFACSHFSALSLLTRDQGARQLVNENSRELQEIEVSEPYIFYDIDRVDDLL